MRRRSIRRDGCSTNGSRGWVCPLSVGAEDARNSIASRENCPKRIGWMQCVWAQAHQSPSSSRTSFHCRLERLGTAQGRCAAWTSTGFRVPAPSSTSGCRGSRRATLCEPSSQVEPSRKPMSAKSPYVAVVPSTSPLRAASSPTFIIASVSLSHAVMAIPISKERRRRFLPPPEGRRVPTPHFFYGKEHIVTILYVAIDRALAVVSQRNGGWGVDLHLVGSQPQCLAVDPLHQEQVYCGTFDQGLWRSADAGASWEPAGAGIAHEQVMSVAVSAAEQVRGSGVVYAGTEPSAIFRSEDQGHSWLELAALRTLPSAPTWSFPPRPWTSHIRWITPDPLVPGRVFAAAEAGAPIRARGWGRTWGGRQARGAVHTHTPVLPPRAPQPPDSAAGDGLPPPRGGLLPTGGGGGTR